MGLLSSITKIGLAVPVKVGNLITGAISKVTGKEYGQRTLEEAAKTTTGKILGTAITAGAATAAGLAIGTSAAAPAIAKAAKTAVNVFKAAPAPVKTGIVTAAAVATFAPATTKAILSQPETAKTAAAAIVSPAAGLIVGLEQGTGVLSTALKENFPKVSEVIKDAAPQIIGTAAVLGTAAAAAIPIVKDKATEITTAAPTTNTAQTIPAAPAVQTATAAANPVLPQTEVLTATTGTSSTKKRKRSSRIKDFPKVSQSVRLNILNLNSAHRTTKRYLNVIPIKN